MLRTRALLVFRHHLDVRLKSQDNFNFTITKLKNHLYWKNDLHTPHKDYYSLRPDAFTPATDIGSSGLQHSPKSVSVFSTGITKIPICERPSGFVTDKSAQRATYTISAQIASSIYTGTFAGCCFLLSTEPCSCQDDPSYRKIYITEKASYYMKPGGPEAPSKTDHASIIGNSTKSPAPGSSFGNGMVPANLLLMALFSVLGVLSGMGILFCN